MALTTVQSGMMDSIAQYNSFKNRIINGAMVIDQRNAGAAVTPSNTGNLTYIVDRFAHYSNIASRLTYQQVADAPTGFKFSTRITVASQYTPTTTDQFNYYQAIEGLNTIDLAFGSSSASTITVSFWVKASVAGTYNIFFFNAAATRWYATTYTATTSWAQQTVTIPGDQTGTWATDNTTGIWVGFDLGQGATNLGTTGAWSGTQTRGASASVKLVAQANGSTLNITGVQLEKGSTATAFDYRPYTTELQLCQRYYTSIKPPGATYTANGVIRAGINTIIATVAFPTTMRTTATIGGITSWVTTAPASTGQVGAYISRTNAWATITGALTNSSTGTTQAAQIVLGAGTSFGGAVAGDTLEFYSYELTASAEL